MGAFGPAACLSGYPRHLPAISPAEPPREQAGWQRLSGREL